MSETTHQALDTIALAGNPNSGKTTLFNALTGQAAKVGNYSGVTVAVKTGEMFTPHGRKLRVVDLPGCYSLKANSLDEKVAFDFLAGGEDHDPDDRPDLVVCVVDASNLERHLNLTLQVIELGLPVVVALNMVDLAEKGGVRLDPQKFSEELGVPVVPMQANADKGIVDLKHAIRHPFPPVADPHWKHNGEDTEAADRSRRTFIQMLCSEAARRPDQDQLTFSDKVDSELLHPLRGWIYLAVTMFVVFWAIFSFAAIPMGWIESAQEWLAVRIGGMMAEGDLRSLVTDGIIGGVGSVIIFLPQIVLLFLFIGLLESSGYMARAAFLMDRVMGRVGLSGKAFLPLFSSYACAIPGVMATRTIDSAKERLVTIFIAPWMSCSARLPVYFLLVPMLLGRGEGHSVQAMVLFGLYAIGTGTALIVAKLLRKKLGPDEIPSHFMLELPAYRAPQWSYIFRHVCGRAWAFLRKAGTIILGLTILLWALSTYPKSSSDDPKEQLAHSAMGRIGAVIEPVVAPLGFDGRVGTAILTSFAAREVFNATMAILYQVEETDDEEQTRAALRDRLAAETRADGSAMFTPLTVMSLLIFYIYALQCLPTTAVVARETGSWRWGLGQFFFMTVFAYISSMLVFQGGKLLGF
ncbi:MAG: ferrous iron transporter B [Verrucomicrobia bacterium]|nr:ferrous iron transporter B [Verrucomicrobiota bacterium]